MITASAAWVAAHRELLLPEMFIEIEYTVSEPGLQEDAVSSGSEETAFSRADQIVSPGAKNSERYSTLEHGMWGLDGSFPYFSGSSRDPGYVADLLSGADGTFGTPPKITITFSMLHTMRIPGITITWSEAFYEWATDFRISAWADSNLVTELRVTGNTSPRSTIWMNLAYYNRLEIEILKWSLPYHRARCTHIALGIQTVYTKEDLLGFEHVQSADLLSAALPKNTITFKLRNEDDRWNPDNPLNAGQYLMDQQEMRLRYGMDINGEIEWIEGGLFWLDEWNIPSNGLEASFTARDEITFMHDIYAGPLSGTLYEIAEAALIQANLPSLSTGADIYFLSPVLKKYSTDLSGVSMENMSISAVLQMVAHAANCVLHQNRLGTIRIEPWNSTYTDYIIDPFLSYSHPEYTISKPLKAVSVGFGDEGRAIIANRDMGEIQTVDNPMLRTEEDALRVGERAREVLSNRKVITGEFRADVRLDCLDPIIVTSKYASNVIAVTEVSYSTTGGAFRGKYTGRVVSIRLKPEAKHSGEFYVGEF